MKRFLSVVLALSLALSLAACGGTGSSSSSSSSEVPEGTPDIEPEKAYSVAMVTDVGGVNDQSFNQSAWEGLQVLKDNGCEVKYLESKQGADYTPNLDKVTDEGHDLIWGIGFMMADAVKDAATRNPDQMYAIVDNSYGDETLPNVVGVVFKAQEPSFLVGYIAGRMTKTDKVGFIGGMKSEPIDQFEYGYRAGVAYAAKELGKPISVDVQYVGDFSDAAKGKSIALKMYGDGCDIIFHAAGNAGNGMIEAAKEKNLYCIGVDRDQNDQAPSNVITSAMKKVGDAMIIVSEKLRDGEKLGGTTQTFGLAEKGVGIAPTTDKNVPEDILKDEKALEESIIDGTIVVPYNEDTFNAYVASLK